MQAPVPNAVCVSASAQRIHASSATYLALMKDCVYELHLRGETEVKSLKQLLEEESRLPYYASEEMGVDGKDLNTENIAEEVPPWDSEDARNSALTGKEDVIARLLNDIMTTPKRSWSRFKKGGLRSCFGVRLERIGSFRFGLLIRAQETTLT
ncbi:C-type natriuretic peptide 3 [Oncorhynchus tshawytscha]|uniref:C-type natriuretic peptide 3 n=1 Tax=Oncorhynchus tshawytscha TaxID=74940 RepID=UPI000D0A3657|nr:C-type natriuretic peptide 3 [Oncorhynchus tshawytscha]